MRDSFLKYLFLKARKYETLDINNKKKESFWFRNMRYLISYPVSLFILLTHPEGYSNDFLQLSATIIAILIGLFLTTLVFAVDKFYVSFRNECSDYKIDIYEDEVNRNIDLSVNKVKLKNSNDNIFQIRSLHFIRNFNILIGKSVVVGIFDLVLICFNILYIDCFDVDIFAYTLAPITFHSFFVFCQIILVIFCRFFICYWIVEIFYNAIHIIAKLVNYMSVGIKK